jgi:hypothetical protein
MDSNTLVFAKVLVDSEGTNYCGITTDLYHKELEKLAQANKRDGESLQQSYVRLSQESETGALLLKAALWAPAPKQAPQDFVSRKKPEPIGEAARELDGLATELARRKGISRERASGQLMADPSRQELVRRVLAEEKAATREVSAQRWPMPARV